MTRKLALSARQVTALCKGASKAGFIPEVTIGDVVVRLLPESSVEPHLRSVVESDRDEEDREYRNWPGPNLNHREEKALKVLVKSESAFVAASGIPYAGSATVTGLLAHGLVELEPGKNTFDRSQMIRATNAGLRFFTERSEHFSKYRCL